MPTDSAWRSIRLSCADYSGGEADVIASAFRRIYIARNAPPGMALLGQPERDGGYRLYFTPDSQPHANALLMAYTATPDTQPSGPRLKTLVGDAALALGAAKTF